MSSSKDRGDRSEPQKTTAKPSLDDAVIIGKL
jgi:hypothetical protein